MKRLKLKLLFFAILLSSCSVLTETQLEMVNKMSAVSDSISVAPVFIFRDLAEVRKERGLFFASSLNSTEAHLKEIDGIADGVQDDAAIVRKANLYVNVLESYLRALRSISGPARWEDVGRELRGIGRGVDSLLIAYNNLDFGEDLKTGHAVSLGKSLGYISREYLQRRQAVIVKEFVTVGDSIVEGCCEALVQLLKKGEVEQLIANEEQGLQNNYEAYIRALKLRGEKPSIADDRQYLALRSELVSVRKVRNSCVSSLKSLRKAHRKVMTELQKRKKITELYEEIIELNNDAAALRKAIVAK